MTTPNQPRPGDRDALRDLLDPDHLVLVCGESVDDLLEQAAAGQGPIVSPHQSNCVHCQAAIGEFIQLWAPVQELAAETVPAPARLTSTVIDHVHRLVHDVWHTLELTDIGAVRVAARVVASIARDTARRVPGVRVALGRTTRGRNPARVEYATTQHHHPNAAVGVLGRTAVVELALAVSYGSVIDDIAREVQQRVNHELQQQVGLRSVTVNVTIDDILK